MKPCCRRFGRWVLAAAALPLLQATGCWPGLLSDALASTVSNQYAGALFTSLETVMFNLLEY